MKPTAAASGGTISEVYVMIKHGFSEVKIAHTNVFVLHFQDYSKLGILKRQFPTVPILALTATATPRLAMDVKTILEIQNCVSFRTSFLRNNLHYEVHG